MNKYSMTCTCGTELSAEANSREEAVEKIQGMMTEEAIAQHAVEKHQGEPVPTKEQSDAMIEQNLKQV